MCCWQRTLCFAKSVNQATSLQVVQPLGAGSDEPVKCHFLGSPTFRSPSLWPVLQLRGIKAAVCGLGLRMPGPFNREALGTGYCGILGHVGMKKKKRSGPQRKQLRKSAQ